jgi:hypothetical protein
MPENLKAGDVVAVVPATPGGLITLVYVTAVYDGGHYEGIPSHWWTYPGKNKPRQWYGPEYTLSKGVSIPSEALAKLEL